MLNISRKDNDVDLIIRSFDISDFIRNGGKSITLSENVALFAKIKISFANGDDNRTTFFMDVIRDNEEVLHSVIDFDVANGFFKSAKKTLSDDMVKVLDSLAESFGDGLSLNEVIGILRGDEEYVKIAKNPIGKRYPDCGKI